MTILNAELHCHNIYSNFHTAKFDTPYDADVTIRAQLESSLINDLDLVFITNHNTLCGYNKLIDYKNNHHKYDDVKIYPAEEVTSLHGEHMLVYGLTKEIKTGLTIPEILDEVKKQDAISSAPHPFGIIDSLREKSIYCDMIEIFNSNNVDIFSNIKATLFAHSNNMISVSGSDSHTASTLGKCINQIESVNKLDDVLFAMKHGKIKIYRSNYISDVDLIRYLKYKINNSRDYINNYIVYNYPHYKWALLLLLKLYEHNMNSYIWKSCYKISVAILKQVSFKINFLNIRNDISKNRNLNSIISLIK